MAKRDSEFDRVLVIVLSVGDQKARCLSRRSNFWDGHLVQP